MNDYLIQRMAQGDHKAFEQVFHTFYLEPYQRAYFWLRDKKLAVQVIQAIFTDIWERREEIQTLDELHNCIRALTEDLIYEKIIEKCVGSTDTDT